MAASSSGFAAQVHFEIARLRISTLHSTVYGFRRSEWRKRNLIGCCCSSDAVVPIGRSSVSRKTVEKKEEKCHRRVRVRATPALPFASSQSRHVSKQEKFSPRCTPRNTGPQSRDTPPKRDTGIANEKDWGINLLNEHVNESGTNEDGSTWYQESGEDLGENGYRCRWARMGGKSQDGTSEWKETVYEHFVPDIFV